MYIPHHFKNSDIQEVKDFIDQHGFAILVNQTAGKLWATHIPLILKEGKNQKSILLGHISKANPAWKGFVESDDVLAIFHGPHSYISSSWYTKENVPTWNYIAVHIYGKIQIIEGVALKQSLAQLMDKYEAHSQSFLKLSDISEKKLKKEIRGIVGFTIEIEEIQAAYKLSQNRNDQSFQNIIEHLEKSKEANEQEMAKILRGKR